MSHVMRCACVLFVLAAIASPSVAAVKTAISSSWWDYSATWSPAGMPSGSDDVYIRATTNALAVSYWNTTSGTSAVLYRLTIDGTGAYVGSLSMDQTHYLVTASEVVGGTGAGSLTQSSGTHVVQGRLTLAQGYASSGTLFLGSWAHLYAGDAQLGDNGNASISMIGGTFYVNGFNTIGAGQSVSTTFTLSGGYLSEENCHVGWDGRGTVNQTGGTNVARGYLALGQCWDAFGYYNLSGSSYVSAPVVYVGYAGTGVLTQTNGTVNVTGSGLVIARDAGSNGLYRLSGGTVSVTGDAVIGLGGKGTMIQTAGTHAVTGNLAIAGTAGASGTYVLQGGNLTAGGILVGCGGTGYFSQSGGTASPQSVSVGFSSPGRFSLDGGSLSANWMWVGRSASGTLAHTGGTAAVSQLVIGYYGAGHYQLSGSNAFVSAYSVTIGESGTGSVDQSAGTVVCAYMDIGQWNGKRGSYTITGGQLTCSNKLTVGDVYNSGIMAQSGGVVSCSSIDIGYKGSGTVSIAGGSFTAGELTIGYGGWTSGMFGGGWWDYGNGTLVQSGGTCRLASATLGAGQDDFGNALGTGNWRIGGSASIIVGELEVVNGWISQTGGSVVVGTSGAGYVSLHGQYDLLGGRLTANIGTPMWLWGTNTRFHQISGTSSLYQVDVGGNCYFDVDGGYASMCIAQVGGAGDVRFQQYESIVNIGSLAVDSGGRYQMITGTLITGTSVIGGTGAGMFSHMNGMHTYSWVTLGAQADATGTYSLTAANVYGGSMAVGGSGVGYMSQSGGYHEASSVYLGMNPGSSGTYRLSGGTLSSAFEWIGNQGAGHFCQSGGTNLVGMMGLGQYADASGTYTLAGGILSAHTLYLTYGSMAVVGGTALVESAVVGGGDSGIGRLAVDFGGYAGWMLDIYPGGRADQSGGQISVTSITVMGEYLLEYGTLRDETVSVLGGSFVQSDGLHFVGSALVTGASYLGATGAYVLCGGELSGSGEFINNGEFTQYYGSMGLRLTNNGTFQYWGGVFPGTITNNGWFFMGEAFRCNGFVSNVPLELWQQRLTANGAGFENNSELWISGTLDGAGPCVNYGLIVGQGTIGGGDTFANYGQLSVTGGNLALSKASNVNMGGIDVPAGVQLRLGGGGPLTNSGCLELAGGTVMSGTVTNSGGVIEGRGTITSALYNAGVVRAVGGVMSFTRSVANYGTMTVDGGSFAGTTINNSGRIDGHGSIANPISNSGRIEADGTLILSGALSNNIGGSLLAGEGDTLVVIPGLNMSFGSITLTGGTFDNNGAALTNQGGQIVGYGTVLTGTLVNNGSITLAGGLSVISGHVVNSSGKQLRVSYDSAVFTGTVVNYGAIKNTAAHLTFAGAYVAGSGGVLISDPADNFFQDAYLAGGDWTGGAGDRFFVRGGLDWSAGAMTGSGGVTYVQAPAVVHGQAPKLLAGWTLSLEAPLRVEGPLALGAGAAVNNASVLEIAGGGSLFGGSSGATVSNGGTILKTGPGGGLVQAEIDLAGGLIDVREGDLTLAGQLEGKGQAAIAGGAELKLDAPAATFTSLQIAPGGRLDIGSCAVAVEYAGASPYQSLWASMASSYDGGSWIGAGIASGMIDDPTLQSVAIIDNNSFLGGVRDEFGGRDVTPNSVLVSRVLAGDVDMSGEVNAADYFFIDFNLGASGGGWACGDLDYSGETNAADYFFIDFNLGVSQGSVSNTSIPEPATLAMLTLGGLLTLRRRHVR
jgi:hypothetical protein